jgi:nitrite reductase/ring-hydroxylating ferredoxin subunit
MNARGVRRFVGDLLRGRRPRPFAAEDPEDIAALRAAITLAAARPGADAPRSDFVAELHRKLAEDANQVVPPAPRAAGPTRRRVLITGSVAAGAATIGGGLDHVLTSRQNGPGGVISAAPTLEPNVGTWRGIGASADLAQGGVQRFDLGSVVGFVTRDSAGVRGVSGICTHLGCRLNLDNATRQLDCPCHNTSFAVTGALLHYQLAKPPAPLPQIEVREKDGQIEVYVPV